MIYKQHKVLFVDDEPHVTEALKRALRKEPYEILSAQSAAEALDILAREPVDVIVSDEQMPGMKGSELLALVCRKYPNTIRIILTGHATLEAAVRAINEGEIYRFFIKPCNEADLAITIRNALQHKDLMAEAQRLLGAVKHQSELLKELEKYEPGITKVRKDLSGAIVIEDPALDFEMLMEQIDTELNEYEALFPDSR